MFRKGCTNFQGHQQWRSVADPGVAGGHRLCGTDGGYPQRKHVPEKQLRKHIFWSNETHTWRKLCSVPGNGMMVSRDRITGFPALTPRIYPNTAPAVSACRMPPILHPTEKLLADVHLDGSTHSQAYTYSLLLN